MLGPLLQLPPTASTSPSYPRLKSPPTAHDPTLGMALLTHYCITGTIPPWVGVSMG